MRIRLQV